MKHNLTSSEKQEISDAIEAIEQQTSGELVAVIADSSDEYYFIPVLWAAVLALALPGLWYLFNRGWGDFSLNLYLLQVLVFVVLTLLFRLPGLKVWLIPRTVKHRRAAALARREFLTLGLHTTHNRAAIMVFVSVFEHYVEILADDGVDQKVEPLQWQQIVDQFIMAVKASQFAQGFLTAIVQCGDILETHFPPDPNEVDELPNHLIEI